MRLTFKQKFFLTFFSIAIVCTGLAYATHRVAIFSWNKFQLQDYAKNALHRGELAVDFSIVTLVDKTLKLSGRCSLNDQGILRERVFSGGALKNIRVLTDKSDCWAYIDPASVIASYKTADDMLPARNKAFQLFRVSANGTTGLGVQWVVDPTLTYYMILETNQIVFSLLPRPLRPYASASIELADGEVISRSSMLNNRQEDAMLEFGANSRRFPLRSRIMVEPQVLWNWNLSYPPTTVALVLAFILNFAYFLTRALIHDKGFAGELDEAIRRAEIKPFYQPIYDLGSENIKGFEVLARWVKQSGSLVPPNEFIPFAEQTGRINDITRLLLNAAGRELAEPLKKNSKLKINVNFTPDQFLEDGFVENLLTMLKSAQLPPSCLVVEVTERQSITDSAKALEVSKALAKLGIRVAIDDAGTGHNGLSSIHSLDAHFLKIDKYFIDALLLDEKASVLIEMLASLAKELGMSVVAEGIETEAQAQILRDLGIGEGQGFHFSRPVPGDQLPELLADRGMVLSADRKQNAA